MFRLCSAAAFSLAVVLSAPAFAADAGSPPPAPANVRGDLAQVLGSVEKQVIALEQATPQAKFTWRPAKGVRSVAEVYLHVAGGIYFLLGKVGHEAPADVAALMQAKKWETQTTNKDELKTILTNAFAFFTKTLEEMPDAELEKSVDLFGKHLTERAVLIGMVSHCSEHLGQSIAYARMNGIVPPWNMSGPKD